VIARGSCIKHGAYGICLIGVCAPRAINKSQHCAKHGVPKGCARHHGQGAPPTQRKRTRTRCGMHSGDARAACVRPGGTTKAQARGFCSDPAASSTVGIQRVCVCIQAAPPKHTYEDSAASTVGIHGLCASIRAALPMQTLKKLRQDAVCDQGGRGRWFCVVHCPLGTKIQMVEKRRDHDKRARRK
jgi:hypothetical protein